MNNIRSIYLHDNGTGHFLLVGQSYDEAGRVSIEASKNISAEEVQHFWDELLKLINRE